MTGDQLSIDDLPELGRTIPSRTSDPETSHAAEPVKVRAGTQRAHLLAAFFYEPDKGFTDEQAMRYACGVLELAISPASEYAKRCSELREGGFIEPTGETRPGSSGPQRIVSRITDKGRAWIRENR